MLWYYSAVLPSPECVRNEDCRTPEVCHTGTCLDACLVKDCAVNAICKSTVHDITCICREGFTGDGRSFCNRCKCSICMMRGAWLQVITCAWFLVTVPTSLIETVVAGCDSDNECPDYTACRNSKCINPCAEDRPCAPSAICQTVRHQARCTCPDGFIGNPSTECKLRKIVFVIIASFEWSSYSLIHLSLQHLDQNAK